MKKKLVDSIDKYIMSRMMSISIFVGRYENILEHSIAYHKENIKNAKVFDVPSNDLVKLVGTESSFKTMGRYFSAVYSKTEINLTENLYKSLGLHALFLLSYSYFEHCLVVICNTLKKQKNLEIGWQDLKGSTLESIKNYLSKVVLIDYNFGTSKEWELIRQYLYIRNLIAHNGNIISDPESYTKAFGYIEKLKGISLTDQNEIIIEKEFIQNSLSTYAKLFANLFASMKKAT
ncbi:MAG: hypothetical protein WCZ90_05520 [Melioribacteraceae bacterium]